MGLRSPPICYYLPFYPHTALSELFPQVLGLALILLCTFNVAVPLWRIQQGQSQTPEVLIHPTVWLTTMVMTSLVVPAAAFPAWVGSLGKVETSLRALHSQPSQAHLNFLAQSFAMFLVHVERKKGVRASGVLFGYWLLCCLLPAISAVQQASSGVSGGLGHLEKETRLPFFLLPFPHRSSTPHGDIHPSHFNAEDTQAHPYIEVPMSSSIFLF